MKITIPISVLLVLLIASCGGDKPNQINNLKDEVMGLHDEVMPKMGDLRKASKSLMMKAETLDSTSAAKLNTRCLMYSFMARLAPQLWISRVPVILLCVRLLL